MQPSDLIPSDLPQRFAQALPPGLDYASLRVLSESSSTVALRRGVLQPLSENLDCGAMVTVHHQGGLGYAATPDLSAAGLRRALERATRWAEASRGRAVFNVDAVDMPASVGAYRTAVSEPSTPAGSRIASRCCSSSPGRSRGTSGWSTGTCRCRPRPSRTAC